MPHDKRKRQPIKTAFTHTLGKVDETKFNHSLDQCNTLPLSCWQGSQSLYSVITRSLCVFFCALNIKYIRVLSGIENPFGGNTGSRSIAVEITRYLQGITLKTIGVSL